MSTIVGDTVWHDAETEAALPPASVALWVFDGQIVQLAMMSLIANEWTWLSLLRQNATVNDVRAWRHLDVPDVPRRTVIWQ